MARPDLRQTSQLRNLTLQKDIAPHAAGSVLIGFGNTRVICSVMVEESVPRWMKEQGVAGGWVTAEYSMLPYSTLDRKPRDITKGRIDGRSQEIQRLIGRSLRAVVDLEKLGQRTLWVDCDVLQADGGTRTASITGAVIALLLAFKKLKTEEKIKELPLKQFVAAVSVGIVDGEAVLDLCYVEDSRASVDMNIVMTEKGEYVEIQGSGEESTFTEEQSKEMMVLAKKGIMDLVEFQKAAVE
ncbi:MAG: ribonuclease PH [Verrucomicrobiota bacterium]|nr:ribonuclease PH [Verrucomicrobiota bacterium]